MAAAEKVGEEAMGLEVGEDGRGEDDLLGELGWAASFFFFSAFGRL